MRRRRGVVGSFVVLHTRRVCVAEAAWEFCFLKLVFFFLLFLWHESSNFCLSATFCFPYSISNVLFWHGKEQAPLEGIMGMFKSSMRLRNITCSIDVWKWFLSSLLCLSTDYNPSNYNKIRRPRRFRLIKVVFPPDFCGKRKKKSERRSLVFLTPSPPSFLLPAERHTQVPFHYSQSPLPLSPSSSTETLLWWGREERNGIRANHNSNCDVETQTTVKYCGFLWGETLSQSVKSLTPKEWWRRERRRREELWYHISWFFFFSM